MGIPRLKLPSNSKMSVQFREPTVDDCLEFSDINEDLAEKACSEYLNAVQVGEVQDARLWTVQDRMLALWWIFVTTSPDTLLAYEYPCECGQSHFVDIDLLEFDEEAIALNVDPFIDHTAVIAGVERSVRLHPVHGEGAEYLEEMRIGMEELSESELRKLKARLKVAELACKFDFKDELHLPFAERMESKLSALKSMSRSAEYPNLVIAVQAMNQSLAHGLNTQIEQGKTYLQSLPIECENGKGGAAKRLLIPFLHKFFIPAL